MLSRGLKVAIGFVLTGGAVAYAPFADVEEFNPVSMHQFCDPAVKTGIRHCEGNTHRQLEDGGTVSLKWAMHVDPDRILSIDTEQKHGVRLVKCTPSSLELELPASHVKHAQVGELIVASHFVHGCKHLMQQTDQAKEDDEPVNHNLYHRIVKVLNLDTKEGLTRAKVWTRELDSLGTAVGSVTYDFDYSPPEASDDATSYPERRTWDGDYNHGKWSKDFAARRLDQYNKMKDDADVSGVTAAPGTQILGGQAVYNDASAFERPQDNFHGGKKRNSDIDYSVDGGQPLFGGQTVTSDDVQDLLNLKPKKVANFGWNWDFELNASQDISFNYTVPGSKMYVMIKRPYIKAHSKLRLRFRSYMPSENAEDTFFTDNKWVSLKKHASDTNADIFEQWVPRVKWEASMKGHGEINAGILAQMRAQLSIEANPLELIQIPVLQDFWTPKWFGTVDFNMGNLPVSLTPGLQFKAKFFHYGSFRGSLSTGIRASPKYDPKLQFDSFSGLRVDLDTEFRKVTVTPPNWMVSTSHFECGIALEPTIWIKGHLGQTVQDTTFAAALRPYFNMTITRAGHTDAAETVGNEQRELVIYPFRVIGMPMDSKKRYKVRITTHMASKYCTTKSLQPGSNLDDVQQQAWRQAHPEAYNADGNRKPYCDQYKRTMDSSEGLNWGEIELEDPIDQFSFGYIAQAMVMRLKIQVQLVEVDYSSGKPFERYSEWKRVHCTTIMNGVCQPSPQIHEFMWGNSKVKVYLHALWKKDVRPWMATRIRGVATSFPEVIINKDYIQQVVPDYKITSYHNKGTVHGSNVGKPLVLVLRHAFKSYPVEINKHNGYVPDMNSSSMTSDQVLELGASFLSTWDNTCIEGTKQCDPSLVLYYGDTQLAKAAIPRIPWNTREAMSGTFRGIFGSEAAESRIVPVSVALRPTFQGNNAVNWAHVGLVRMKFAIANPAAWNKWISPTVFTPVKLSSTFKLVWSLNNAHAFKSETFQVIMRRGVAVTATAAAAGTRAVADTLENGHYLRPSIGNQRFEQMASYSATIEPTMDTTGGTQRTRYEYDITFSGASEGETVMVTLSWVDVSGNTHTMYASPFLIETPMADATTAAPTTTAAVTLATTVAPTATTVQNTKSIEVDVGASGVWEERRQPNNVLYYHNTITGDTQYEKPAAFDDANAPLGRLLEATNGNPFANMASQFKGFLKSGEGGGWQRGEDGQWTHTEHQGDVHTGADALRQCSQKDLQFGFGAGIMFKAYVKHLSLPKDLPILGAIQGAPELGTPWESIAGWSGSNTDLQSKLPDFFCRHGACSATLPGCPQYNMIQHYYPKIKIHFKHTLRYPAASDAQKDQWIGALKTGLSYTFAVLPEAITIAMHYLNHTVIPGVVIPGVVIVTAAPVTAAPVNAQHRRRFAGITAAPTIPYGEAACENHGYTEQQCGQVGCCLFVRPHPGIEVDPGHLGCHSFACTNQGCNGICTGYNAAAVAAFGAATTVAATPAATVAPTYTLAATLPPQAGGCSLGDLVRARIYTSTQYPARIASINADGTITVDWDDGDTTHRVVSPSKVFKDGRTCASMKVAPTYTLAATLAPTPAPIAQLGVTAAAGPQIEPLTTNTGRRLSEHTETHVHAVTVSFAGGLKYEMDNILMDEMIKEGLFKSVEDVPSGDTPLRIHSYEIQDLTPAQKYSVSETIQKAVQSSQTSLVLSAFVGCALLGVTFVVRRARNSYQRVEENYFGPVE